VLKYKYKIGDKVTLQMRGTLYHGVVTKIGFAGASYLVNIHSPVERRDFMVDKTRLYMMELGKINPYDLDLI